MGSIKSNATQHCLSFLINKDSCSVGVTSAKENGKKVRTKCANIRTLTSEKRQRLQVDIAGDMISR